MQQMYWMVNTKIKDMRCSGVFDIHVHVYGTFQSDIEQISSIISVKCQVLYSSFQRIRSNDP